MRPRLQRKSARKGAATPVHKSSFDFRDAEHRKTPAPDAPPRFERLDDDELRLLAAKLDGDKDPLATTLRVEIIRELVHNRKTGAA